MGKKSKDLAPNDDAPIEVGFRPTVAILDHLEQMAGMGIFGGPTADEVARELVYAGVREKIREGWFDKKRRRT